MKLKRTDKQFTKENMSIAFIKQTVAIACAESTVLNYEDHLFDIEVKYHGRMKGGSKSPWEAGDGARGYEKKVSCVYIRLKNSFDSYARIFDEAASLQGFFKDTEHERTVCQINTCKWANLLLENGFLTLSEN